MEKNDENPRLKVGNLLKNTDEDRYKGRRTIKIPCKNVHNFMKNRVENRCNMRRAMKIPGKK